MRDSSVGIAQPAKLLYTRFWLFPAHGPGSAGKRTEVMSRLIEAGLVKAHQGINSTQSSGMVDVACYQEHHGHTGNRCGGRTDVPGYGQ